MCRKYFSFLSFIAFVMLIIGLVSCGSDDDDDHNTLDNYIVGTWRSYKGVVFANGESATVEITKTGEYSSAYFEFAFLNGNQVLFRAWMADENGISHWIEAPCRYTVGNNVVNVIDASNEVISMTYEPKDKNLFIRSTSSKEGIQFTTYIYFRK